VRSAGIDDQRRLESEIPTKRACAVLHIFQKAMYILNTQVFISYESLFCDNQQSVGLT